MKRLLALSLVLAGAVLAQRITPVKWSLSAQSAGDKVLARMTAKIDPGWHLYSLTTPRPSLPTVITVAGVENPKFYIREPKRATILEIDSEFYENEANFLIETAPPDGAKEITATVRFSVCDDKQCLPPQRVTLTTPITKVAALAVPPDFYESGTRPPPAPASAASPAPPSAPAPSPQEEEFGRFLLIAFGAGLLAIFTPCVFPMIPITMSYFLNRKGGSGVAQAGLFCLGIIVLFSGIGLITTTVLGMSVAQLGGNPWVNGFIALIFFVFGLSLLGAFEITLPSGMLTRLDSASQRGGILGTLLMGLTFSLTSFACVGPFVGPLLAASAQSGGSRPLIGMAAFATGLSAPFFLLAVFPGVLKKMPKSGGWLPRVKVVMGFILLAAMLKYLSSVDQVLQWNLLTRERFLALWVILFGMAGLYLLGFLRLEGVKKDDPLGLGRLLTAVLFLAFALSLVPGMFGGRLGDLDAYVPLAPETQSGAGGTAAGLTWMKDDYQGALERARAEGKRVLVNFTGYACTNCHWMKANMFPRPEIAAAMQDFVRVELYMDGLDARSEEHVKLQETKFKTFTMPYYAILDPDENVIATSGYTSDPKAYLAFLTTK